MATSRSCSELLCEVLDRAENAYEASGLGSPPIVTGIHELDLVLGGGLPPGHMAVINGDSEAQMNALVATLACSWDRGVLVAVQDPVRTATLMVASHARLTLPQLRSGQLGVDDWARVNTAVNHLAVSSTRFTDIDEVDGLSSAIQSSDRLLVIDSPHRFRLIENHVADRLSAIAADSQLAVIVVSFDGTDPVDAETSSWATRHLTMRSEQSGRRAVIADPVEGVVVEAPVAGLRGWFGSQEPDAA